MKKKQEETIDTMILRQQQFEDSKITKSFSQGSTKISSDIVFGRESVDKVKYCSLSLDEPYSRIMKKGQMDILVRFWDSDKDCTN